MGGPVGPPLRDPSLPDSINAFGQTLFEGQSFDDWANTYKLNTAATFFVTNAFLGLLEAGALDLGAGETSSVINISGLVAKAHVNLGLYCYSTTKAALQHLTITLATDYALQKIPVRVNAIAAGFFLSEKTPPAVAQMLKNGEVGLGLVSPIPTRRGGREEEMTMAVLSLVASAGYTNGQVINLDGGFSLVNP